MNNPWRIAAIKAWEGTMILPQFPHHYLVAERDMDTIRRLIDLEEAEKARPSTLQEEQK